MLCIFIGFVWDKEDLKNEISNEGEIKFSLFSAWMIGIKYLGIQLLSLILLGAIGISGKGLSYSLGIVFTLQIVFHVLENKRRVKSIA
ncbi:MAG: hypothetical protein ACRC0F_11585, partial [Cetobacterium sp.]